MIRRPIGIAYVFVFVTAFAVCRAPSAYGNSSFALTLTLQQALTEAQRGNPDLRAIEAQAVAQDSEAAARFYLPPPMLSLSSMGMNGPLASDGHMRTTIQLTQDIPFPAKISGKREAARQEALAARASARARWLELRMSVRRAYFEYWRSREAQSLIQEKIEVLEDHIARLKVGSLQTQMLQAHLVAVKTDLEIAHSEMDAARAQESAARGELNALMGRDAFDALGAPEEPALASLPAAPGAAEVDRITEAHPMVAEARSMMEAAEAEKAATRGEWFPDFQVAWRQNNSTSLASEPSSSELMVGVTLPFAYFWQPAAMNRVAGARAVQAEAQLHSRRNSLRLQLLRKHAELAGLRAQLERYRDNVLKGAQKRLQIAHGIAPTDTESLNEHRESTEKAVEFRMKALELRVDYEKALAEYQSALGEEPSDTQARQP